MTDTATHITQAMAKVEAIRKELQDAGAKTSRVNLATRVYNDLVDAQTSPSLMDTRGVLESLTEYLAGGREALAIDGNRADPLWDGLEAALAPLVKHVEYVWAYGTDE